MQAVSKQVARALLTVEAVKFAPDNPVRFKSGILSPVYVDNRRLPFWPDQWHTVIASFQTLIHAQALKFDVIAGIEAAGIPHSAALAYALNQPSVFVRKSAKEHGTRSLIESGDVSGKQVILVEDMVTTGGSSLAAIRSLREAGAICDTCLSIISYGFQEAAQAFAAADIRLLTLTTFAVVLEEARAQDKLDARAAHIIGDWFEDPHGWAERHGLSS